MLDLQPHTHLPLVVGKGALLVVLCSGEVVDAGGPGHRAACNEEVEVAAASALSILRPLMVLSWRTQRALTRQQDQGRGQHGSSKDIST